LDTDEYESDFNMLEKKDARNASWMKKFSVSESAPLCPTHKAIFGYIEKFSLLLQKH
jgi:hypothetical protein